MGYSVPAGAWASPLLLCLTRRRTRSQNQQAGDGHSQIAQFESRPRHVPSNRARVCGREPQANNPTVWLFPSRLNHCFPFSI
ncbi:hypothetical protein L798_02912 [Zootermopsis nevadensis]|uniref:Uncharacterized protein n=1 Tax=Zootermopsis nevadensis TaxID=136037 RepID=A0A067QGQ8_ZOONE|nr:hypothetical protein L798_02912 [Zootermopsis nevadensis]